MVNNVNGMFYATSYHPIQAGSIDGTDITAHDNGVYRALLASATGLYDPLGDLKVEGDPYCSLFVGRLSALTDENSLRLAMSTYGRVKNLRLVRHIVTGASCGYAFVEFESEKDMRVAYEQAHLSKLDGATILVDYNRQQLMSGWIPRRLGGGLGGKKESGQLRFGGRDRPFRAPLRPIPHEELRKLGIPLPPEGRYMTWFQVPPIPQRRQSTTGEYDGSSKIKQHRGDEYESRVKEKDASEAEEARERDRHRPRRDEFSDRKHRSDPEPSSKYEGHYEVEPRRPDSRDEEKRSRRREQSLEYNDEDRKRHRSERRYHTEQRGPDPEPSRSSRRNAESDGRHRESSRYRSEDESEKKHRHSESERKHRHGESKNESHEKKHRHGESKHRHSESKHHRHRDREEAGSPSHEDHEGKRHKKHKRVSRGREEKKQTSRV